MIHPTRLILAFTIVVTFCLAAFAEAKSFKPAEVWLDTDGNSINAHGGGLLYHEGKYYWYGEIKKGKTWRVGYIKHWECYRTKAGGVSCYSSENLYDWKYEGVALAPNTSQESHDLHFSKVLERPKVIYNEKTKKFVMWLHVDSEDYKFASTGIAVSDTPTGPFTYLYSMHPGGQMSRDMTLFVDDDGKAYHVSSSENNATTIINLLSDDYLRPSGISKRTLVKESRESPAVFKHDGKYYMIGSGLTAWDPNPANIAVADEMLGEWKLLGNPCVGKDADKSFQSQSTYVLQVPGKRDAFIYLSDRWKKTDLEDSRYIWLPIEVKGKDKFEIRWQDEWDLEFFDSAE